MPCVVICGILCLPVVFVGECEAKSCVACIGASKGKPPTPESVPEHAFTPAPYSFDMTKPCTRVKPPHPTHLCGCCQLLTHSRNRTSHSPTHPLLVPCTSQCCPDGSATSCDSSPKLGAGGMCHASFAQRRSQQCTPPLWLAYSRRAGWLDQGRTCRRAPSPGDS
jgi:hypothetical protein